MTSTSPVSPSLSSGTRPRGALCYDRWADHGQYIDLEYDDLGEQLAFQWSPLVRDGLIWVSSMALWYFTLIRPVYDLVTSLFN